MAGRRLLCNLSQGLWQARSSIHLQSPVELSIDTFFTASNRPAGSVIQGLNERCFSVSVVRRLGGICVSQKLEYAVEPTYGVGPVMGGDRNSKTKGATPDDFRALDIHAAEPKEITKDAAAKVMQEPPDYQINKVVPKESKPFEDEADPQRTDTGKAFESRTRKQEGTAQYQGDTKGTEKSGHEVEGQYGAGPDEGKTSRA